MARLEVGLTFAEAAEGAEVKLGTAQGWRARGKREESGPYADFTAAVEKALARETVEPMTEEEHRAKVSEVARKGNVQALKLMWEMILADRSADETEEKSEPETGSVEALDELAHRRATR